MPNVMSPLKWYAYNIQTETLILLMLETFGLSLHLKTSSALMMKDAGAPDIVALQARGRELASIFKIMLNKP